MMSLFYSKMTSGGIKRNYNFLLKCLSPKSNIMMSRNSILADVQGGCPFFVYRVITLNITVSMVNLSNKKGHSFEIFNIFLYWTFNFSKMGKSSRKWVCDIITSQNKMLHYSVIPPTAKGGRGDQ